MKLPSRSRFSLDIALRYYPVVQIINKGVYEKILEVGSGTNGITDYYEGDVIGLDSDFTRTASEKNQNIFHKKGTIYKIPFKGNIFDCVICLDTFEHLPKDKREKALTELLRVTKKDGLIILGFPCGNLNERFEGLINRLYKLTHGAYHSWLTEHKQNGLPKKDEVLNYFRNQNMDISRLKIIENTNIFVWFVMHFIFTVFERSILSKILKFGYIPLFYLMRFNLPPFYRLIFVIKK